MRNVLVIGASGQVGRILVSELTQLGIPTVAAVRNKHQLSFQEEVTVVEADLESDITPAMDTCETVVFLAGSGAHTGADKTLLVDLWGAVKAIEAARSCDIKHFIMVSARDAGDPDRGPVAIKPYLIAKHFADGYLECSGLNFTILRPGRFIDIEGEGLITTQRPSEPDMQFITRSDTASAIVHCINNPSVIGNIYEIYAGSEPIDRVII